MPQNVYFCTNFNYIRGTMKRFTPYVFILIAIMVTTASCKHRKMYADYLKDEAKAIDLFISKNNLTILNEFPKSGVFREKEFYKDPTGVYYHIISYGDTTSKLQLKETIYIRFKGLNYFMLEKGTDLSNFGSVFPEEMTYVGPVNALTMSSYANPGWAVPLEHVGHNGKVKMIIPFEMGSQSDQSNFQPSYYDFLTYRFESKVND